MHEQWKSLAELARAATLAEVNHTTPVLELERREFIKLAGASLALAGVAGCSVSEPHDVIVPYREQPPEVTPGRPTFYATATTLGGYASGVLAESHQGRPTKLEGNPLHPASLGATDVFTQASILGLYDPHRLQNAVNRNVPVGLQSFVERTRARVQQGAGFEQGQKLRFLLEATSSPTLARTLEELKRAYPQSGVTYWEPCGRSQLWQATQVVYGRALDPMVDVAQADVVVSLDSDFLTVGPWHLVHAKQFASRRKVEEVGVNVNRLYVVESDMTSTGALADHRLAVPSSHILSILALLFSEVAAATMPRNAAALQLASQLERHEQATTHGAFVRAMARDLHQARGKSVVLVGTEQPPFVQALAMALNELLGNLGTTVSYVLPAVVEAGQPSHDLQELTQELERGEVDTLVVLGGDPVRTAPHELHFASAMAAAKERIHLTEQANLTSTLCQWVLPRTHTLESWSDARAYDGTACIIQPLVRPLYEGQTDTDLLQTFLPAQPQSARDSVRQTWATLLDASAWRETLVQGRVKDSASVKETPAVNWEKLLRELAASESHKPPQNSGLELRLVPDPRVYDGRFISNPWLLELPAPITTLSWDNALHLSVSTGQSLGVADGDIVTIESRGQRMEAPVLLVPGHADSSATLSLGFGQHAIVGPGHNVGFNAFVLRSRKDPYLHAQVTLTKTGKHHTLVVTQSHWSMAGREVAKEATLQAYLQKTLTLGKEHGPSIRERKPDGERQWGMVIDLGVCSGCNACVVACQAENNIPVVGKSGVAKSREMYWLRIDRYFSGPPSAPTVLLQPMLCQHCENAPCEYVCPTHATTHSPDGLNEMTYNRCVGTRFCANNCPYKVRRFNWFNYHRDISQTQMMQHNPDVTVRARGVMEKCTFCVQRLRQRGIDELIAAPGQEPASVLQTACQAACASRAITFGDLRNPQSSVSQAMKSPRLYGALEELNTAPRVRYLAKLTNKKSGLDT